MIERLKDAYADNKRFKLAAFAGLLLCAVIFAVLSGGFPPLAWRFLLSSVLPSLPHLLALHGGAIFLPLLGLLLLSLALLIVWVVIVTLLIKIGIHLWQDYRASQDFTMDLQEAEQLAERNMASNELDRWFEGPSAQSAQSAQPVSLPGATSALHSSVTEAMPTNVPREYATSGRPVRVSGGGLVFPETPTPAINPTFMAPAAPSPVSLMRDRSAPWIQPRTGRRQDSSAGSWQSGQSMQSMQNRQGGQSGQGQAYNPTNSASLPPFSPPAPFGPFSSPGVPADNPARKQLRIVPPPPIEEISPVDSEQSIDKAFSALLERERSDHSAQSAPSRYPTRPEWADVEEAEDVPHTSATPLIHNEAEQPYLSMLQELASGKEATDFDPSTEGDAHINIYDTVPIDEGKLTRSEAEADEVPRLVVGIGLDPGIKRRDAPNEDSIFAIQGMRITDNGSLPAGLFVVADGMGGHANGREASRMAIHTVSDVIVPALLRDVSGRDAAEEETIFQDMLKDGVHRANLAIYRRNREMPEMMGTTLTAALIANSTAYIGNVGDSRTYLYRPSEGLQQVTRDHSEVARLVEAGAIAPEDIYTHPKRNRIYRCLGERASVEMDSFAVPLQPGDLLLLCSDGLWEMVRDLALEKLIASSAHNPVQLSAVLVQAALNHGGADNISVVVVGFLHREE